MIKNIPAALIVAFTIAVAVPVFSDTASDTVRRPVSDFVFFPDVCSRADVGRFFLQKPDFNGYFKERYFVETNMDFTFVFVSFRKKTSFQLNAWIQGGMGQTPNNVVFDPMDVSFGLLPTFEYHFPTLMVQAGLDHSCFHEIDRKDFNTTYINKIFLSAGSLHARFHDFWQGLYPWPGCADARRFSWFVQVGRYLKGFPGIQSSLVNYENDKEWEADITCRYALLRAGIWTLYGEGRTLAGYVQKESDVSTRKFYWRQDFEVLNEFRGGENGLIVFARYSRDHLPLMQSRTRGALPRFSRDGLLQVGIRYSN